nr:MAG TPA: hypothetical protein [Caudoviricetes sp.]
MVLYNYIFTYLNGTKYQKSYLDTEKPFRKPSSSQCKPFGRALPVETGCSEQG